MRIRAGIHTASAGFANRTLDDGFDFVSLSSEARILVNAAAQIIAELRKR